MPVHNICLAVVALDGKYNPRGRKIFSEIHVHEWPTMVDAQDHIRRALVSDLVQEWGKQDPPAHENAYQITLRVRFDLNGMGDMRSVEDRCQVDGPVEPILLTVHLERLMHWCTAAATRVRDRLRADEAAAQLRQKLVQHRLTSRFGWKNTHIF